MRKSWVGLMALVGMIAACAGSDSKQEEALGVTSEALSSSGVLGFESSSGWSTSAGTLSLSSQASEGSSSLALSAPGYAQLTSIPLTSLGQVGNQLTLDLRLGQTSSWAKCA